MPKNFNVKNEWFGEDRYYSVKYLVEEQNEEDRYDDYDEGETFEYWFNFGRNYEEEMELEEFA